MTSNANDHATAFAVASAHANAFAIVSSGAGR